MWETDVCDLCRTEVPAQALNYIHEHGLDDGPVLAATCESCSHTAALV